MVQEVGLSYRLYLLSLYVKVGFKNEHTDKSQYVISLPFPVTGVFFSPPFEGPNLARRIKPSTEPFSKRPKELAEPERGACLGDGTVVSLVWVVTGSESWFQKRTRQ